MSGSDCLNDNRIQKRYTPGGLHFREKSLCLYGVDVFHFHDMSKFRSGSNHYQALLYKIQFQEKQISVVATSVLKATSKIVTFKNSYSPEQ